MRIKKSVPKDQVLHTCNWNSMEHYYKKSIARKTYKIYNNLTSPLLRNLFTKSQSRSTRYHFKIDLPRHRLVKFNHSCTDHVISGTFCLTLHVRKDPLQILKRDIDKIFFGSTVDQ